MAYTKKIDWFDMWFEDKRHILSLMHKNMASDIECGYNPCGHCIREQMEDIKQYGEKFDRQLLALSAMEEDRANRWCYYDMVKRGVIEP